jgi:hypothetical protein
MGAGLIFDFAIPPVSGRCDFQGGMSDLTGGPAISPLRRGSASACDSPHLSVKGVMSSGTAGDLRRDSILHIAISKSDFDVDGFKPMEPVYSPEVYASKVILRASCERYSRPSFFRFR